MHTFVIPAYQSSPYLELCIQSILSQTVKSNVIITTSTPTDHSAHIAEKYGISYYINNKSGIANDWNFALSKVTTPLATIAHQDDIYEPDYAQNIISAFKKEKDTNTLIAFTDYKEIVNNQLRENTLNGFVKRMLLLPFVLKKSIKNNFGKKLPLIFGNAICCPSVTFNLEKLKDFKFSTDFTYVLDWYSWYQLADRQGAFVYIDKKLIRHRIHEGSETTNQLLQGTRKQEELKMFSLIWGRGLASVLSWFYTLGHAGNKLQANSNSALKR